MLKDISNYKLLKIIKLMLFLGQVRLRQGIRIGPRRGHVITRMTTFIKTKIKKSDDHTNIDKYKEYLQILQNVILYLNCLIRDHHLKNHDDKAII